MGRDTNSNFLNGVPELLILRLLHDREMYGYEIVETIRRQTGEIVTCGEGVVYPILHSLEREGALTSRRKTINGRSRVYYCLTTAGRARFEGLTESWSRLTGAVRLVLTGGPHEFAS